MFTIRNMGGVVLFLSGTTFAGLAMLAARGVARAGARRDAARSWPFL